MSCSINFAVTLTGSAALYFNPYHRIGNATTKVKNLGQSPLDVG